MAAPFDTPDTPDTPEREILPSLAHVLAQPISGSVRPILTHAAPISAHVVSQAPSCALGRPPRVGAALHQTDACTKQKGRGK